MDLPEKLQELRKQKGLTQEALAEALYVSRTAVSKWESGRGVPSIDSLKAIAGFYGVSIDQLLSGEELVALAETDSREKIQRTRDLVFGLLDCAMVLFLFVPIWGQKVGDVYLGVSLLALTDSFWYVKGPYYVLIGGAALWGVLTLALQTHHGPGWTRVKSGVSMLLSTVSTVFFIMSQQPYAATFAFLFLLIKGMLLLKRS